MAKGDSRKTRRAQAARERAREAHARLVVQRQGDPRFVQQTRTATGRTIQLRPQDVALLREQEQLFVAKFGREPGPDDPLFFDPTKEVPTELDQEAAFTEIRAASVAAGIDPAFIDAWHEVGYLITEDNRHLFSAHEVEAYEDAVQRAWDRADTDELGDDDFDGDIDWEDDDGVVVVDLSEQRIAAARDRVLDRLALSNEHAIAAARDALARQLGSIITMTTEDGEPMADVDIVRIGIYQPDEDDDPAAEHVENVASTLREESLDWLEGARRDDVEAERMPALADFVALCDDAHLIDWVRIQMAPPHDSVAGHNPTEAGG